MFAVLAFWAALAVGGPSEAQAQASPQAEPELQSVRSAPLEEFPRPRAGRRLLLPHHTLPSLEELPELIGGLGGLIDKMRCPPLSFGRGFEGAVLISFVVNEAGYVERAAIKEGTGSNCSQEALRVVREARFKPGVKLNMTPDGNWVRKVVPMEMSLPFTFHVHRIGRPELPQRHWAW